MTRPPTHPNSKCSRPVLSIPHAQDNAWIRCHELATEYNISHICFGPGNGSPENFLAVATDKDLQVWKLIVNMDLVS